ncbi:MAG: hypothetical protein QW327_03890 [Candidatus Odinarchaeota archaeon]
MKYTLLEKYRENKNMIDFIIVCNNPVNPEFNFKDVPGTSNRLDVIIRSFLAVVNSNFTNHLKPRLIISFEKNSGGAKTIFVNTSVKLDVENEFAAARLFKTMLKADWKEDGSSEGLLIKPQSFKDVISCPAPGRKIYYLHGNGRLISDFKLEACENIAFIVGDNNGLTMEQENFLEELGVQKLSLGPVEYLTSQCMILLQYWLTKN